MWDHGCESWIIKKAEHWRIDAFELWCWRRLLRVPWTAGRSNQSILKEISPEYSLEVLMLKLRCQYFGHLIWRANSLEKTLMWEKIEGKRRRGWQRIRWWHHQLNGHEFEQTQGDSEGQGSLACCRSWGTRVRHDLGTEQQNRLKVCYHTKEMFPLVDTHILLHMVMDIDSCSPITISETLGKFIELLWTSVFSFIKCEI